MKKSLNQYVTSNRKKQNRYNVEEKSTRNNILDYSWCFETVLDLMSEIENKFEQIWFLLTSSSYEKF